MQDTALHHNTVQNQMLPNSASSNTNIRAYVVEPEWLGEARDAAEPMAILINKHCKNRAQKLQ